MNHLYVAVENAANNSSVALLQIDSQGQPRVAVRRHEGNQQHAEHILPMLDALLQEYQCFKQDIQGVAFSQGPGAFTGLRIACGVAQGLALGLDLDVVAVDSLYATASMVQNKSDYDVIVAVLDARMQEAYLAVYTPVNCAVDVQENNSPELGGAQENENLHTMQEPVLIAVADIVPWLASQMPIWQEKHSLSQDLSVLLCGNALDEYAETFTQGLAELAQSRAPAFKAHQGQTAWPDAGVLVQLAYQEFKAGRGMAAELVAPLYLRDKVAFTTAEREQGMGGNPKASLPQADEATQQAQAEQVIIQALSDKQLSVEPMVEGDIAAVLAIEQVVQSDPWTHGMFADSLQSNYAAWVLRKKVKSTELAAANQLGQPPSLGSPLDKEQLDQEKAGQEPAEIVGYALQMFAPDVAHLLTIAIAPGSQQQGLGHILLQWTEQQALQAHLNAQMLEVRVSNTAARALYEKQGYSAIGIRKGYYKGVDGQSEDALVLQKNIL